MSIGRASPHENLTPDLPLIDARCQTDRLDSWERDRKRRTMYIDEKFARHCTQGLVSFLLDVTDRARRRSVFDVINQSASDDNWSILWLDDELRGVAGSDVVLQLSHRPTPPPPSPPTNLGPWFDGDPAPLPENGPPKLRVNGPASDVGQQSSDALAAVADKPPGQEGGSVRAIEVDDGLREDFQRWVVLWEQWAEQHRVVSAANETYERLAQVARDLEQQDDAQELVLAAGLVTLIGSDQREIRRHLLTERVVPSIDGRRSTVTVTRTGNPVQIEHRELFEELVEYQTDRAEVAAAAVSSLPDPLAPKELERVAECLASCIGLDPVHVEHERPPRSAGARLELSHSPALIVRPRSQVALAEAYRKIGKEIEEDESSISVGLAQLVVDTEADQRLSWIERQGGERGLALGEDPLFPLPTNEEQRLVMDLLGRETSVVVQGPPGTGKTHTIANLISALLAEGQRVLVTSQKDQALRVLRDKIPEALRPLCVLLAGGKRSAAEEMQNGLDALSNQLASADSSALVAEVATLRARRNQLKAESAQLNTQIRDQRIIEQVAFHPSESGLAERYDGKLGEIVRVLKREEALLGWLPPSRVKLAERPPISADDMLELNRTHPAVSAHWKRGDRWVPEPALIPTEGAFAELVKLERLLALDEGPGSTALVQRLSALPEPLLNEMQGASTVADDLSAALAGSYSDEEWVADAVRDLFSGRRIAVWANVRELSGQFIGLAAEGVATSEVTTAGSPSPDRAGALQALSAGVQLLSFLRQGGRFKKRFPSSAQREAASFLELVRVDGAAPSDVTTVEAAVSHLRTELAGDAASDAWRVLGAVVVEASPVARLADLQDKERRLAQVFELAELRQRVQTEFANGPLSLLAGGPTEQAAVGTFQELVAAINAVGWGLARRATEEPLERLRAVSRERPACHELRDLLAAADAKDVDGYDRCRQALVAASRGAEDAARFEEIVSHLRPVHPQFSDALESSAGDLVWAERATVFDDAWQWARARGFVESKRNADAELELLRRYAAAEHELQRTTEQLAAKMAMVECLHRLTNTQAMALQEFRVHQNKIGAGTGKRARRLRHAALDSMRKAMPAVPAWVVPLPNLLDHLPVERDSFDVVIVDEASQVGIESLFLLWLAPRVIVVGDDKQCSPGRGRLGKTGQVFNRLDHYLGGVGPGTRGLFTDDKNLYDLLTARSGKDSVIRLREHFRCMPEIINYSSKQFYEPSGSGLVALRERTSDDLDPLQLRFVEDGYSEGRETRLHNRPEAEAIVRTIRECLDDPRYDERTFGVVVLRSTAKKHVQVLEALINDSVTTEERETRRIRVGIPADFQGDERDVIMLSMVDVGTPNAIVQDTYKQAYNVAASRARDQMWLFTSLRSQDLKKDLRGSLVGYMQSPPSVFGASPELDDVSETEPTKGFDSLLEQRVFREIRGRGYHVVPQYKVGTRSLDLVVVGADGQRLAVECDGDYWHESIEQNDADARRDRELGRMGWRVLRVRESEFELDRERALTPVWEALHKRGIYPDASYPLTDSDDWSPVELPDEDEESSVEKIR